MNNEARNLRQNGRDRCLESRRRRQKILFSAQITDNIDHTQFSDTSAAVDLVGEGGGGVGGAVPDADEVVVGGFQGGQGVGDGGGNRERLQRRLAEAEVRYLMCQ